MASAKVLHPEDFLDVAAVLAEAESLAQEEKSFPLLKQRVAKAGRVLAGHIAGGGAVGSLGFFFAYRDYVRHYSKLLMGEPGNQRSLFSETIIQFNKLLYALGCRSGIDIGFVAPDVKLETSSLLPQPEAEVEQIV